jgi:predicted ATPase
VLLVMDNCEHLVAGAAALVDRLLARCARLRVLATSREPLGIDGEHLAIVAPLGLPETGQDPAQALTHPSVQLFADRAAATSEGFAVDDDTVGAVIEICRRLDGLPLAIELAAARLRSLPVAQVAARLDDRFRLLTGGSRTALERQRTLRAVVDWSWDLLSEPERLLAARLAVFPAGVTPETAAAVCAGLGVPEDDVLDLLGALVDRSLLVLADPVAPRYRMLETLREYGIEKLGHDGDLARLRTAHARYFAQLADDADAQLRGPEQVGWFRKLGAERDNVLAALRWLCDDGDEVRALRLAVSLGWYWLLAGGSSEALGSLRLALAVEGEENELDRLIADRIVHVSDLMSQPASDDDEEDADRWGVLAALERLATMDLSPRPMLGTVMPVLALFFEAERAEALLDDARAHADPWVRASVPLILAEVAQNEGDVDEMRVRLAEADAAFHEVGDRWALAIVLSSLGLLRIFDADLEGAADACSKRRRCWTSWAHSATARTSTCASPTCASARATSTPRASTRRRCSTTATAPTSGRRWRSARKPTSPTSQATARARSPCRGARWRSRAAPRTAAPTAATRARCSVRPARRSSASTATPTGRRSCCAPRTRTPSRPRTCRSSRWWASSSRTRPAGRAGRPTAPRSSPQPRRCAAPRMRPIRTSRP